MIDELETFIFCFLRVKVKGVKDQLSLASIQYHLPSGMGRILLQQTSDPACLSTQQVFYLYEA